MDEDATIYWVDPATKQKTKVGVAKAYGGELPQNTHVGHRFHYEGGQRGRRGHCHSGGSFVLLPDEER